MSWRWWSLLWFSLAPSCGSTDPARHVAPESPIPDDTASTAHPPGDALELDAGNALPLPSLEPCSARQPRVLVTGNQIACLAVDDSWVYYGRADGVWAVSRDGASDAHVGVSGLPISLVHSDLGLHWSVNGIFYRATGATESALVIDRSTAGVGAGGGELFFSTWAEAPTHILRAQPDGSAPTVLYEADRQRWFPELVVHGGKLYAMDLQTAGANEVMAIDTQSGQRTVLGHNGLTHAFAVDDQFVWWTEEDYPSDGKGRVRRVAISGGATETFVDLPGYPVGIAVDDQFVYVTVHALSGSHYTGQLVRLDKTSRASCQLGSHQGYGVWIETDAAGVYWLAGGDGDAPGAVMMADR